MDQKEQALISCVGSFALSEGEAKKVAELIAPVWPGFEALFLREAEVYRTFPDLFQPFFVVSRDGNRIVGFSLLLVSLMSIDLVTVTWVIVDPAYRGKRIGRALVDACLAEADRRGKQVMLTTSSPEFYKKIGFNIFAEYSSDEKSYILTRRSTS